MDPLDPLDPFMNPFMEPLEPFLEPFLDPFLNFAFRKAGIFLSSQEHLTICVM